MSSPIEIMDEIGCYIRADSKVLLIFPDEWQSLRTAIEAQAEELAQARARIVRLDDSHALLLEAADRHLPGLETLRHQAERVMYESPAQSLAAVRAEALREYANTMDKENPQGDSQIVSFAWGLRSEADRIEREAKESK